MKTKGNVAFFHQRNENEKGTQTLNKNGNLWFNVFFFHFVNYTFSSTSLKYSICYESTDTVSKVYMNCTKRFDSYQVSYQV